jgi:hypothetical protein
MVPLEHRFSVIDHPFVVSFVPWPAGCSQGGLGHGAIANFYLAVSGNGLVGSIPIIGPISADMTP